MDSQRKGTSPLFYTPFDPSSVEYCALLKVVVIGMLLELRQDPMRVLEGPVREHDDVLSIERLRFTFCGIDHKRSVVPSLFLEPRVAVVPVGAVLTDRETIGEGFARPDPRKRDARYTIHRVGEENSVPVDGAILIELVRDVV